MSNLARISSIKHPFESAKERSQLTKMIMKLFKLWKLTTREQLLLLGMRENSRYMLQRYRNGESIIPFEKDKLDRAGLLLVIYEDLFALFPDNETMRYSWVKKENKLLDNNTPLDCMINQGILGLSKISRFLDMQMVI